MGRKPNETLRFAGIGVGGKGSSDIDNAAECGEMFGGEVVALCDINEGNLNSKANQKGLYDRKKPKFQDKQFFAKAQKFTDFRKLFDDSALMKTIDAVVVSTADHTHAHASILAMRLGKHCYCEKPLTHSVWEARQMAQTAAKHKVATQMGNQGTASGGTRTAAEILRSGPIARIGRVVSLPDGAQGPQGREELPNRSGVG
jgi:predicted dehydrogenase